MIRKCAACGRDRQRIQHPQTSENSLGFVYKDEAGGRWSGRKCPQCKSSYLIGLRRALGQGRMINKNMGHAHALGYESELCVKAEFERLGYGVEQSLAQGPDLILTRDGVTLTCEVKSVTRHKYKGTPKNAWFVSHVSPPRRKDDLIAVVFDKRVLFIEPMNKHLCVCSRSGQRTVTDEVKALGSSDYDKRMRSTH